MWRQVIAHLSRLPGELANRFRQRGPVEDLPTLLAQLGQRYAPVARTHQTALELDVDPAVAADLTGPMDALGGVLGLLLDRAISVAEGGYVALQVDLVGETRTTQTVHLTVADDGVPTTATDPKFLIPIATIERIGGSLQVESGPDIGTRVIVELTFSMPRRLPRVDIDALRSTLGGPAALCEVIVALDHALSRDLADLDGLLAKAGTDLLQAWLHRVAGVLGMAEASGLAQVGLLLERDLANGRDEATDSAVRGFGDDAAAVLALLREHLDSDRL
jgi:HPt (histidine-containing phosphotransfer) domain-containing protein